MEWIRSDQRLPESDDEVLAYTAWGDIALAVYQTDQGLWQVQPFRQAWYETTKGVLYWQPTEKPQA